jgi:type I restriction-modification system DNA methylase subunit
MALFQPAVLKKYISGINEQEIEEVWGRFTAHFHNPEIQKNIRGSKEEEYQDGFLSDLFVNVLRYSKYPASGYNLKVEQRDEKGSRKADGALLADDKVLGVIELKGTDTTDLDKVEQQAFGYKNYHSHAEYVIISNFEKLRFYIDNAVDYREFNLFELTKEEFKILWLCLEQGNFSRGLPKKIKDASLTQNEEVTKQLYADYSAFKDAVFKSIVKHNPDYDKLRLFKKTQKLLDRFLFIFFAEDQQLLPPNSIRKIIQQWQELRDVYDMDVALYDRFKKYFGYLNTGHHGKEHEIFPYNGGLFESDEVLDNITIEDELLYKHALQLSKYDFASEVDVNILGHIFEHSLNEIEQITAELEGQEVDTTKTRRKKDGVFYTPKYITQYIVENTVGKLCEEKKAALDIIDEEYTPNRQKATKKKLLDKLEGYREWLLSLTICDPACGSGAFLNQALEFLMEEHHYLDELQAKLLKESIVYPDVEARILENNLFGVDINEESVEIAKLSLWLRTAQKGRKLTSLNNNIKCGNSLIDDPDVAGEKAFNWEEEFPDVFSEGGFDVVIGNPPYVQSHSLDKGTKDFIYDTFKTAEYQINTYGIFTEKAFSLIKDESYFGFIIPNFWLSTKYDSKLRKLVFHQNQAEEIINLFEVFEDATVDTCILIGKRIDKDFFPKTTKVKSINPSLKSIQERLLSISSNEWYFDNEEIINKEDDKIEIRFHPTLDLSGAATLKDFFDFKKGMQPYEKGKGIPPQTREMMNDRIYHSDTKIDDSYLPLLKARNVQRYMQKGTSGFIKYGENLAAQRSKNLFEGKRILLNRILSDEKIDGLYLEEEIINNSDIFNLLPKDDDVDPKIFLPLIVSKLCATFFKLENINLSRAAYPKINVNTLEKFPIPELNDENSEKLNSFTHIMQKLHSDLNELTIKFSDLLLNKFGIDKLSRKLQNWHELTFKQFLAELKKKKVKLSLKEEAEWMEYFNEQKTNAEELKTQIAQTDREIDEMVYELYGLGEEEIRVVEGGL